MIALDTNVIVRFLTKDDMEQYQKAYRLFSGVEELYIATTVVLETEWVLRFTYGFPSERIMRAFLGVLGLENVIVENETKIITALQWQQRGLDFADALHLAHSLPADKFASFDKKLIKKATGINTGLVLLEP